MRNILGIPGVFFKDAKEFWESLTSLICGRERISGALSVVFSKIVKKCQGPLAYFSSETQKNFRGSLCLF